MGKSEDVQKFVGIFLTGQIWDYMNIKMNGDNDKFNIE